MTETVQSTASVVLVGKFNPFIFQPEWLRKHKIIGEKETEVATDGVEVIHPEVSILNLINMKLVVDTSRFSLTVLEEPFVRGRDFVVSCFSLLPHSPVTAVGINREIVFRAQSVEAWHKLGDALAPKEPWMVLLGDGNKKQRTGGMRSIVMERSLRTDEKKGYVRVTVEALETGRNETKINYNDHYVLATKNKSSSADAAVELINQSWDQCMEKSAEVFDVLLRLIRPE